MALFWPPFLRAGLALALVGGFGLGGALGASLAFGLPLGSWWPAAAQAHGHVQLVGWAGLTVLGVGFHFLPRLRGARLWRPELARVVLVLIVGGVVLRLVGQPLGLRLAAAASGPLELAGAWLAVAMLICTWRQGPPLAQRAGLRPVLPFFAVGFGGLLAALAMNAVGLVLAAVAGELLVAGAFDTWTVGLTLEGFLLPVAVGMSMRLFPLYFRTRPPNVPVAQAGLGLWEAGLLARLAGFGGGALVQAVAVMALVAGLGVFGRRTPLPRRPFRVFSPIHLHALTAYGWLVVAALARLAGAADSARHALGAGFVTLLILGVGAELLPGFAGRPLRDQRLPWATLGLGNAAALLRVIPALWPLATPTAGALFAAAGLLGLLAVAAFGLAVPVVPRPGPGADGGR